MKSILKRDNYNFRHLKSFFFKARYIFLVFFLLKKSVSALVKVGIKNRHRTLVISCDLMNRNLKQKLFRH